jgi:hypothetical protein
MLDVLIKSIFKKNRADPCEQTKENATLEGPWAANPLKTVLTLPYVMKLSIILTTNHISWLNELYGDNMLDKTSLNLSGE